MLPVSPQFSVVLLVIVLILSHVTRLNQSDITLGSIFLKHS